MFAKAASLLLGKYQTILVQSVIPWIHVLHSSFHLLVETKTMFEVRGK